MQIKTKFLVKPYFVILSPSAVILNEVKNLVVLLRTCFAKNLSVVLIFILFLICPIFSKNIAVIPFQNITGDKEKNWVGAGFSETLTTKLVKVSEITVL